MQQAFDYESNELETLSGTIHYQQAIMRFFAPHIHGHVLEVGAGIGVYSDYLLPLSDHLSLIEPDAKQAKRLAEHVGALDSVTIHATTIETYIATAPAKIDSVVMINVLEHIQDDIKILQHLYAQLKPGGALLIFVPALQSLFSDLDRKFGHYRRYSKHDLVNKVQIAGFHMEQVRWFDPTGILPWYLLHTLGKKTEISESMAKIYDQGVISWMGPLQYHLPMPIGKNLLLIARK
ncbi:class I SAM-dependent methyltransferase [Magnetococcus sp. PR-3]|uniref:class I SAM-dependent methyltransferase n=1 Tax=Magnetococcus sp. PR-3 TaxID=3120355 RepID=UPI002FCE14DA